MMKPLDSRSFTAFLREIQYGNQAVIEAAKILLRGYKQNIPCLSKKQYERLSKFMG